MDWVVKEIAAETGMCTCGDIACGDIACKYVGGGDSRPGSGRHHEDFDRYQPW